MKRNWRHWAALLALPLLAPVVAQPVAAQTEQPASGYAALLALYDEFRTLTVPEMTRGVPDYTPAAMQRQACRPCHWG